MTHSSISEGKDILGRAILRRQSVSLRDVMFATSSGNGQDLDLRYLGQRELRPHYVLVLAYVFWLCYNV
jgi:hypothetical protein